MKKLLLALMFFLAGVACLGFGIYLKFFQNRGYEQTDAVIERLETIYSGYDDDGNEQYDHNVFVSYTIDGKEYKGELDTYESSYEEGKTIKIFYRPDDPADIHGDSGMMGLILLIIGPVIMLGAAFAFLRSL